MFGITPPILNPTNEDAIAFNTFVLNEIAKGDIAKTIVDKYSSYKYTFTEFAEIAEMVKCEPSLSDFTNDEIRSILKDIKLRRGY